MAAVAAGVVAGVPDSAFVGEWTGRGIGVVVEGPESAARGLADRLVARFAGAPLNLSGQVLELGLRAGVSSLAVGLLPALDAAEAELAGRTLPGPTLEGADLLLLSPAGLGLLELLERLLRSTDRLGPFLELMLGLLVERTKAERGGLFLVEPDGELSIAALRDLIPSQLNSGGPLNVSRGLVSQAAQDRRAVLVADALADARYRDRESVVRARIRSALVVPLTLEGRTVGVVYLDSSSVTNLFTEADQGLLTAFARLAAGPLQRVRELARERARSAPTTRPTAGERRPAQGTEEIVGESEALLRALDRVERYAASDAPLMIVGESGTGKELFARAVHACSSRAAGPFVAEAVTAIPESLLEATLFGHEVGAFSGADQARAGVFERANGGTLLLDDADDMPANLQAALLRVLESGEIRRLGSSTPRHVSLRVVCAVRRPLQDLVAEGTFRQDLYYRLNVITLTIPPLRTRRDDVPALARHFLAKHAQGTPPQLTPASLRVLSAAHWPGNVRELENEVRRLLAVGVGAAVDVDDLDPSLRAGASATGGTLDASATLNGAVEALERRMILQALEETGGNQSRAARALGIGRSSLLSKLKRYGL